MRLGLRASVGSRENRGSQTYWIHGRGGQRNHSHVRPSHRTPDTGQMHAHNMTSPRANGITHYHTLTKPRLTFRAEPGVAADRRPLLPPVVSRLPRAAAAELWR